MLASFLDALFDHGHAAVLPPERHWDEDDLAVARERLTRFERLRAADFPGTPPPFDMTAAEWSVTVFYRACQAAVFRDLPAEALDALFATPCPQGDPARLHYSVDLVFQFLPDLWRMTREASPQDPLVAGLRRWGERWPLSSVGMTDIKIVSLVGIVDHPSLLTYYVDRVIARHDQSRLESSEVHEAARRAIGPYADHFSAHPDFHRRLVSLEHP